VRNRARAPGIVAGVKAGPFARRLGREVSMIRKFLTTLIIGGSLALAGCNTVEGIGRDVQSVGETVAETAD
jgi:predicted small secreted protein